jgi:hypothetical protein
MLVAAASPGRVLRRVMGLTECLVREYTKTSAKTVFYSPSLNPIIYTDMWQRVWCQVLISAAEATILYTDTDLAHKVVR